jgi:diadenosine tetraphosphate (Ap4A) HIT family hydrolase
MGGAGGVGILTGIPRGMAEPMTTPEKKCPFCNLAPETILAEGPLALAVRDSYPLNPGHALIVPRRHVASWFDATAAEREEMLRLADDARRIIVERHAPDAFNLGINDGPAAGQTVAHLHLHLIPRYEGDVADPRGGVRWIIPERAAYWIKR